MTTISTPFVNGVPPNGRNFGWCEITPTKIALIYIATTGGTPRYFIQFVNFVDGQPVYGKASLVLTQTYNPGATYGSTPRIVDVGNGRLLFCVPKAIASNGYGTQYTFVLVSYANDIAEFLSESAMQQVSTYLTSSTQGPQLVGGNGNATFYNLVNQSSAVLFTFWNLTINQDDTISISDPVSTTALGGSTGFVLSHGTVRKGLDGVMWAAHVLKGSVAALYRKLSGPQDVTERTALAAFTAVTNQYTMDSLLPIRGDDFLLLNTTSARLYTVQRDATTLAQGAIDPVKKKDIVSWVAPAIIQIYDVEWLDADGTFLIIGQSNSASDPTPNISEATAQTAPMTAWIGKYSEASQSLTISPESPIATGLQISKRTNDAYIHVIDDKTVALIGSFDPAGGIAITPGIVMMKAG